MYCKAKKKFGAIRKFLKKNIFENLLHKKGLKGGISIDADSGPPRYVLWCCGGICHEALTFIQIGCGHTVLNIINLHVFSKRPIWFSIVTGLLCIGHHKAWPHLGSMVVVHVLTDFDVSWQICYTASIEQSTTKMFSR